MRVSTSRKSKYYISKDKRLELTHFCYQYGEWKNALRELSFISSPDKMTRTKTNSTFDPTYNIAKLRMKYMDHIKLVEDTAIETDEILADYILMCVVDGQSYDIIKSRSKIPCGKDYFYNQVRKFYWLLAQKR